MTYKKSLVRFARLSIIGIMLCALLPMRASAVVLDPNIAFIFEDGVRVTDNSVVTQLENQVCLKGVCEVDPRSEVGFTKTKIPVLDYNTWRSQHSEFNSSQVESWKAYLDTYRDPLIKNNILYSKTIVIPESDGLHINGGLIVFVDLKKGTATVPHTIAELEAADIPAEYISMAKTQQDQNAAYYKSWPSINDLTAHNNAQQAQQQIISSIEFYAAMAASVALVAVALFFVLRRRN